MAKTHTPTSPAAKSQNVSRAAHVATIIVSADRDSCIQGLANSFG